MVVGGLQKLSLSDFPGMISAIVFTRGCGFRCPYCHNPELVLPESFAKTIPWEEIEAFLLARAGRIEGVVVSGGEPTVHVDLPERLAELKTMGFRVKLDTNGSNPTMLQNILSSGLADYIAMDVKAPLEKYRHVTRAAVHTEDILASIRLVLGSGLPHEFRTTFATPLLSFEDVESIGELVRGCDRFVVQAFRGGVTLEPGFGSGMPTAAEASPDLRQAAARLVSSGIPAVVR
jgi:pyruvate formate lyase activating enzyme